MAWCKATPQRAPLPMDGTVRQESLGCWRDGHVLLLTTMWRDSVGVLDARTLLDAGSVAPCGQPGHAGCCVRVGRCARCAWPVRVGYRYRLVARDNTWSIVRNLTLAAAARRIQRHWRARRRERAAAAIQREFRRCISDPARAACRRRLLREIGELAAEAGAGRPG